MLLQAIYSSGQNKVPTAEWILRVCVPVFYDKSLSIQAKKYNIPNASGLQTTTPVCS